MILNVIVVKLAIEIALGIKWSCLDAAACGAGGSGGVLSDEATAQITRTC